MPGLAEGSAAANMGGPIDKTVTFFVVFVLLQALSRRFIARFPQGEQAVGLESA